MIYTKNEKGVYVWSENQEDFIPKEHIRMTDEEVYLHLNPPTPPLTIEMIEQGIDEMEDYYLAADVLARVRDGKEQVHSAADVRRDLGLDS